VVLNTLEYLPSVDTSLNCIVVPALPFRDPKSVAFSGARWSTAPVDKPDAKHIPTSLQLNDGGTFAKTPLKKDKTRKNIYSF
jgi:hypothetical protein